MTTRPTLHLLAGVLLFCVAAGCNVFEGLHEEGQADDPQALYQDAQDALRRGDLIVAIDHLRQALDMQPEGALAARIRITLATALLEQHQINVLTLSRIGEVFTGKTRTTAVTKTSALACKFPASYDREQFDPQQSINFQRLGSAPSQDAVAEAQDLLNRVFAQTETSGVAFSCNEQDLDASIAFLQSLNVSDEQIAELLVNYAVVLTTRSYIDVVNVGGNQTTFYYVTPPQSGTDFVSVCFPDANTCDAATASVMADLDDFGCAAMLLNKRAELLGTSSSATVALDVAALAADAYDALAKGLSQPCYAN